MLVRLVGSLLSPSLVPTWSREGPYDGHVAVDMHFSPDRRSLAVVSADEHGYRYVIAAFGAATDTIRAAQRTGQMARSLTVTLPTRL
jgi:hypothetical protein